MQISHLLFADNMLLFSEASVEQMESILKCLAIFCKQSGQKVSMAKSKITFSNNVAGNLENRISDRSEFSKTNNLGKYLGVPFLHNKISHSTYSYVLEKIQERPLGWKTNKLSMAGRVTLCKSILSAMPLYTMQSTTLPKSIVNEIEKLCRGFIWGDSKSRRRAHLIK